jgi:hypothetical protein
MLNEKQPGTLKQAYDKARMHSYYGSGSVTGFATIFGIPEAVENGLIDRGNKIYRKYHPQAPGNPAAPEEAEARRKALVADLAAIDADREAHPLREAQQTYSWLMKPDHYDPDGDAGVVAEIAGYLKKAQQADPKANISLASLDASGSQSDWDVYQKLLKIIENDYKGGLAYQQGKLDEAQNFSHGKLPAKKYLDSADADDVRGQVSALFQQAAITGVNVRDINGDVMADKNEAVARVAGRHAARQAQEDLASAPEGVAYFQGLLDKGASKAFAEMFGEANVPAAPKTAGLRTSARPMPLMTR